MAANQNQLEFFRVLGGNNFKTRQENFQLLVATHQELGDDNELVSPKVFRSIYDDHLIPLLDARTFIVQELSSIWGVYGVLPAEFDNETSAKREELKATGEAAVDARNSHDSLIKEIVAVTVVCAERVNWSKHKNDDYQHELLKWVIEKQARLTGSISDPNNSIIRSELEAVHSPLTKGFAALSKKLSIQAEKKGNSTIIKIQTKKLTLNKSSTSSSPPLRLRAEKEEDSNDDGLKHLLSELDSVNGDDDGNNGGPSKKPKLDVPIGEWWGPRKSKLSCTNTFFDVVREYKAYLANPTHPSHSRPYIEALIVYLRRALVECGKDDQTYKILMKDEWNFRDETLKVCAVPTVLRPGATEANYRLGMNGFTGLNDFKRMLGGGLTDYELEETNHLPEAQGMLALAHAAKIGDRHTLRGGAADGKDGQEERLRKAIRTATQLRFRDPVTLWEQLVEDATYPAGVFDARVKEVRPPMTDPNRIGQPKPMSFFREMMSKVVDTKEWNKAQGVFDLFSVDELLDKYKKFIENSKEKANAFLNEDDRLFPHEPKLNEAGGKDKPKRRYGNLRDKDFAKSIGYAFRARMFQVLRFSLTWRAYILGFRTLRDLLMEEKALLQIWDDHEALYMEWENCRWFTLSNAQEISRLENRYAARELLRKVWVNEIKGIDTALENLRKYPNCYDDAGKGLLSAQFSDESGLATLLDSGLLDKPEYKTHANKQVYGEANDANILRGVQSPMDYNIDTDVEEQAYDNSKPLDLDASRRFLEKTLAVYEKSLDKAMRANNNLDDTDPGNAAIMQKNNIDIMATQQVIWSLKTELHNLNRSLDPLSEDSVGKGAALKWKVDEGDYWKNIKPLPRKTPLPLRVKSLGLGFMPGEHPKPDHPALLLGCPPGFAKGGVVDEGEYYLPADNSLSNKSNKDISHSNYDGWNEFLESHRVAWGNEQATGTALLSWDEWVDAAYRALRSSTASIRAMFDDDSPYKTDMNLLQHVQDAYHNRFNSNQDHDSMSWRKREMNRRALLEGFAAEINSFFVKNMLPQSFPRVGVLPSASPIAQLTPYTSYPNMSSPMTSPPKKDEETFSNLRAYLKAKNEAELKMKKITRLVSKGEPLSQKQKDSLAAAKQSRKKFVTLYKKLRSSLGAAATAQADAIEQEESALHNQDIKTAEALADAKINKNQISPTTELEDISIEGILAGMRKKTTPAVVTKPAPTPKSAKTPQSTKKTPIQQPKPASSHVEALKKSAEYLAEARVLLRTLREKYNEAVDAEEAAETAADTRDDPDLDDILDFASGAAIEAGKEYTESKINIRLRAQAYICQRQWNAPAETAEELRERYNDLNQDPKYWIADIIWDKSWTPNVNFAYSTWINNVIILMHEAYKAVNINSGPAYFKTLYEHFWACPGNTLEKKRKVWLYLLITDYNSRLDKNNLSHKKFVTPPSRPPADYFRPTLSRDELLNQKNAEVEAALKAAKDETLNPFSHDIIAEENLLQQFSLAPADAIQMSVSPSPFPQLSDDSPFQRQLQRQQLTVQQRDEELQEQLQSLAVRSPSPLAVASPSLPFRSTSSSQTNKTGTSNNLGLNLDKILGLGPGARDPALSSGKPTLTPSSIPPRPHSPTAYTEDVEMDTPFPTPYPFSPAPVGLGPIKIVLKKPSGTDTASQDGRFTAALKSASGLWESSGGEDTPMVDSDDPVPKQAGSTNDAWPELKGMISTTWISCVAFEALRQKHGDRRGMSRATYHPDWPRPVRVNNGIDAEYYCL
ncbi:hypothetical protein F5B22DRAFT_646579 [Xylaria bambusicola]|uniref:uncharacterized protein n=1 Tax=Xylaria bambusicola TaxID=326684 RepID=UPI002008E53B|nr:uncharacterized protein F5B22DRAFT_646579 [Xylaria bambusicola]KAI0516843.1 hypothetical protein F5B22DRAFT_646579 [Xylaria bambusicola]